MLQWKHNDIVNEQTLYEMVESFNHDKPNIVAAGFDTETTGLHIIYDRPFLFQFGWCTMEYGRTYTVDIEIAPELARRVITIWSTFAAQAPIYLAHNVKFDLHMSINMGYPYKFDNISDTTIWIRLGSDAIPERKGGAPLGLKAFAQRYISSTARQMDHKLQQERTERSKAYNVKLKKMLGWNMDAINAFFKDKLNTVEDLPEDKRAAYEQWRSELPLYLRNKITGFVTSDDIPYHTLDRKNVTYYGHLDIVWLLEAYLLLRPIVELRGNLDAVRKENENIYPLIAMERVGLKVDYDYLCNCRDDMKQYIRTRREDLCRLANRPIKSSQNAVILNVLHELGANVSTTEAEILDRTVSDLKRAESNPVAVEFIETLQELRTLEKWYSTYIMRFIVDFNKEDGKIYTTVFQAGTVSGRVTSDFQQFPKGAIKKVDGTELFHPRKLVIAQDGDYDAIVYLDYSQIELRLQAFYTILVGQPDVNLCRAYSPFKCFTIKENGERFEYDHTDLWCIKNAYNRDWYYIEEPEKVWTPLDVHGATTKIAFGIDETHPDFHDLRYKGKRVNFAKNYGAQFSKIREMFPEYDDEQIHKIDDAYYKAFPGVKAYHQYCYTSANQRAYMQNMFGVRYYGASGHNLINMLVQGTGAYYLKWKIVEVTKFMQERNMKSQFMMQIHDELQFKKHKDDDPSLFFEIKRIMETWDDTYIPIVADMEVATKTWADKYEVSKLEDFYGNVEEKH